MTRSLVRHARIVVPLTLAGALGATTQSWSTTTRVSISTAGEEADGPSADGADPRIALTPDARFVVFHSLASNLAPGDTNGISDVFVRDLWLGRTERVSVTSAGQQAVGDNQGRGSIGAAIDASGRYVTFSSWTPNLVAGDSAKKLDVFLHDRATGATTRLSVNGSGKSGNGDSLFPSISANGRHVAFCSEASDLVSGDRNNASDVFLRDTWTGSTERVSVAANGKDANGPSLTFFVFNSVSQDGRCVAFVSSASNLVAGDTNNASDVFVRDMASGMTERVSVTSSGQQAATGASHYASLSADGACVAFWSDASNIAPSGSPAGSYQLYVRDRTTGVTECVSVSDTGDPSDAGVTPRFAISADGRRVAFTSAATNLGTGAGGSALFIRDRTLGTTTCIANATGAIDMALDATCAAMAFTSMNSTLAPGDSNGVKDVFIVQ